MDKRIDTPQAHPLSYFQVHPCLRADSKDRIISCDADPTEPDLRAWRKARAQLKAAGSIGGFTVYDLFYYFCGEDGEVQAAPSVRSVLVKTGAGQFHEIHVKEGWAPTTKFLATEIVPAGRESLVRIKFDDGGNYRFVYEDYFVLSKSRMEAVDFAPAIQAAQKAVPAGQETWQPTTNFNFDRLVYSIWTQKGNNKVSCCDGKVEVPFRLENGKVIPGVATYSVLPH